MGDAENIASLFWQQYGVASCYTSIPFAQLVATNQLSLSSFKNYEANDARYLESFIGCFGVLLMKLIPGNPGHSRTVLNLIKGTVDELEQVLKISEVVNPPKCDAFDRYIELIQQVANDKDSLSSEEHARLIGKDKYWALKLVVVLTPCMRLYAEVGAAIETQQALLGVTDNKFQAWVDIYKGAEFQKTADDMDNLLNEQFRLAANTCGDLKKYEVVDAYFSCFYREAMALELEIFNFYSVPKESARLQYPQALIMAGSDSGGGAGIQADMKTMERFGVFSSVAITATTAQNTLGVSDVHVMSDDHFTKQIESCLDDYGADLRVFKSGMVPNSTQMRIISRLLKTHQDTIKKDVYFVCDPVMVTTTGHKLIDDAAVQALKEEIIRYSTICTPNIPEVAALFQKEKDVTQLGLVKNYMQKYPQCCFLLKGGHDATSDFVEDHLYINTALVKGCSDEYCAVVLGSFLFEVDDNTEAMTSSLARLMVFLNSEMKGPGGLEISGELTENRFLKVTYKHPRIHSAQGTHLNDHGTGCTLASAIAAGLALSVSAKPIFLRKGGIVAIVAEAINFVVTSMKAGKIFRIGQGHGPLLHSKGLTRYSR